MSVISYERSFASHDKAKCWSKQNGSVNPRDVYKSSHTKYWFDCDNCNHSFENALNNIVAGKWCSYCCVPSRRLCENQECKVCSYRSFASHDRAKYWSKTNGTVNPRDVFKYSNTKYWFDCDTCNHSFTLSLNAVVGRGSWCPYCANHQLCKNKDCQYCFANSFASHERAKYWSDKNKIIVPRDVYKGSHTKYWFDCDNCNHSFENAINNIVAGQWCSYCCVPSRRLCENQECNTCLQKSIASHERVKYWSEKNGSLNPRDVFKSSAQICWFDCDNCKHSFKTRLYCVVSGSWCPYCANKQLCEDSTCNMCYNNSFASHEKSEFWSKQNGNTKPRYVFMQSNTKYWFDCDKCNHSFDSGLSDIFSGNWCPYCSSTRLCENPECCFCFKSSFASNEKAIYWSKKNGDVKPREIFKCSGKKYWFDCDKCKHSFYTALSYIDKGNWCAYCARQLLCYEEECILCYNNSFASNEKAIYWSKKNEELTPREVFQQYNTKCWFDCDKCNHSFKASLNAVVGRGSWCPYCANRQLCENKDCQYCFANSFASHERAEYWSDKNGIVVPRDVFKNGDTKYWFNCDKCNHSFDSALYNILYGNWCPKCNKKSYSKSQIQWLNFIQSYNNITIQHAENDGEFVIPGTQYKSDGYCKETNTIYEFHGDYWHGNPKVFLSTKMNKTTNTTFGELYQKTIERERYIRDMGYNLVIMWEHDWIKTNKSVRIIQKKYILTHK